MTDTKQNEIKIKKKTPIILKSIHSSLHSESKITITVNKR